MDLRRLDADVSLEVRRRDAPSSRSVIWRDANGSDVLQISVLEIYNNHLRDLASSEQALGRPMALRLDPVTQQVAVTGIAWHAVQSIDDVLRVLAVAVEDRISSMTDIHASSSRSHCVVTMRVRLAPKDSSRAVCAVMRLVDLAGSECVGDSGAVGTQLREARSINRSLAAFSDVRHRGWELPRLCHAR